MPSLDESNDPVRKKREEVLELNKQKTLIEAEIQEYESILESNDNVGMKGPLLTPDGYPRADIDVYAVRLARNRVICLNNDHLQLMEKIEKEMNEYYSLQKEAGRGAGDSKPEDRQVQPKAFLLVKTVSYESPAFVGGVKQDDLITSFGTLTEKNFKSLHDVKELCEHSVDQLIPVSVLRDSEMKNITIRPRKWNGPGLLGCYLEVVK